MSVAIVLYAAILCMHAKYVYNINKLKKDVIKVIKHHETTHNNLSRRYF